MPEIVAWIRICEASFKKGGGEECHQHKPVGVTAEALGIQFLKNLN
jgi:hypothetical protein